MGKRSWSLGFEVCVKVLRAYCNCFIRLLPFFFLNIRLIRFITFCPKSLTLKKKKQKRKNIFFSCSKNFFNVKKKKRYLKAIYIFSSGLWLILYWWGRYWGSTGRGRGRNIQKHLNKRMHPLCCLLRWWEESAWHWWPFKCSKEMHLCTY